MSTGSSASAIAERRQKLGAWAGGLAGPVAWFVQLVGVYALADRMCTTHGRILLHMFSIVCLLVTGAGCFLAWRLWGEAGGQWPSESDPPVEGRIRLMGALGVMAGVLFAWLICTLWIAIALLDPCPP